jgi:GNAT superfamily N-acetyltransferase
MIKIAGSKEDFVRCFKAMNALRTALDLDTFLTLTQKMKEEKYQIAYLEENEEVVAVCGFRYVTSLYEGGFIYIDDLSTLPEFRGKGYGDQLFNYVAELARSQGLRAIHLDSAHHRYDAHRFYLKRGMNIVYHHFRLELL